MTTENRAIGASTATPEAGKSPTHQQLQNAVRVMDGLAYEGLTHIGAIAYITAVALDAKSNSTAVAFQARQVLRAITNMCDQYSEIVANTADTVGCASDWRHYVDGGAA